MMNSSTKPNPLSAIYGADEYAPTSLLADGYVGARSKAAHLGGSQFCLFVASVDESQAQALYEAFAERFAVIHEDLLGRFVASGKGADLFAPHKAASLLLRLEQSPLVGDDRHRASAKIGECLRRAWTRLGLVEAKQKPAQKAPALSLCEKAEKAIQGVLDVLKYLSAEELGTFGNVVDAAWNACARELSLRTARVEEAEANAIKIADEAAVAAFVAATGCSVEAAKLLLASAKEAKAE